jgi:SH3 domain protein
MNDSKRKYLLSIVLLSLLVMGFPVMVSAQVDTGYVSDMLILTLRDGPGNEHKVLKTLKSDAPVQILEEAEGYLKVRTEDGQEGWVARKYITTNTPKPIIIAALNKALAELEAKVAELEEARASAYGTSEAEKKSQIVRIKELETDVGRWKDEALRIKEKLNEVTQAHHAFLEESKNVAVLVKQRDTFKAKNADLEATNKSLTIEIEQLQQDHDSLLHNEIIQWFLAGSGVFFAGLLIGKVSRKKKRY